MRIVLLGTGTPKPDHRRAGTSTLVAVEQDTLLFDCGPGATIRAVAAGYPPTSIDYLFFTHHHFDHNLDYPHLVLTRWDQGAGAVRDLQVFGPPPTMSMTRLLFDPGGVYDADIVARTSSAASLALHVARGGALPRARPHVVAHEIGPGEVYADHHWLVRAAPTTHVEHLRSLAYRTEAEEGAVVIAGDTKPCRSVVDLARGADILIHPANVNPGSLGSTPPVEAGRIAAAAGVKMLVLVHLGQSADDEGIAQQVLTDVRSVFDGTALLGADGMEISLTVSGKPVLAMEGSSIPAPRSPIDDPCARC
ncbi:MAG TPA: MBL fold metallo-hydrolase [Thermoleophilia bacterium]|nr:MBL fold metallo-hydrolase [Thermoleophilia bacterium]